jgi:hypothetical protein
MAHAAVKSRLLNALIQQSSSAGHLAERVSELPERISELEGQVREGNRHSDHLRRIASYLGFDWKPTPPTPLHAAKQVRGMVQRGWGDEQIALYLDIYLLRSKGRRGRPRATYDAESFALRALELHDSDPKAWTWPRIADRLLDCKSHKEHVWDSDCTLKLKKAAQRLRTFLAELQSESTLPSVK